MPIRKKDTQSPLPTGPASVKSINDIYAGMAAATQKEIAATLKKYNMVMHVEHVVQLRPKPQ